jgi:hypothetical protein
MPCSVKKYAFFARDPTLVIVHHGNAVQAVRCPTDEFRAAFSRSFIAVGKGRIGFEEGESRKLAILPHGLQVMVFVAALHQEKDTV